MAIPLRVTASDRWVFRTQLNFHALLGKVNRELHISLHGKPRALPFYCTTAAALFLDSAFPLWSSEDKARADGQIAQLERLHDVVDSQQVTGR